PTEVERHAPSDGDVFRNEFAATDSYKVPNRIGQLWAIDWKKEEIPDNQDSEDDEDDGLQKRPPLDYGFMSDLLVNVLDGKFKEAVKFVADKSAQQLGLQYDKHQRTAAHYAAMRAEGAELLKKLVQKLGTSCLKHEDCNSVTPLQYAAQNYSLQQFNKLFPDAVQELRSSTHRNKLGDTLAHFAARNTGDEEVIKSVLHGNNPHRLLWRNNRGRTVLHEAVEHCSAETVKDLLEQAINHFISVILRVWEEVIEKMKNLKESDGSTLAHCASRNRNPNCKDGEVFRVVEKLFGDECLNWENSMYQTVLQAVIQYSTDSTTKEMVEVFAENNIDKFFTHTDESENGYLHSAARYKKKETFRKILELMKKPGVDKEKDECIKQICDKPNVDGQTVLHFAAERKDELSIVEEELSFDDWGEFIAKRDNRNRNILFYACMKWNFSAFELQSKKLDKSAFTEVDADGNSLLHAVFMNRNNDNGYSSLNKAGVHVVHEFACKYNLVKLMLPLSEIAGVKKAELRSKKVERGPYKGATCLHFACRTGHKSNIAYLVKKSLSIYARDDDGRTCVDYARSADQLKRLAEGTGKSELEFLRLLDPTRAALKLPDRTAAMQYISQIVDQSESQQAQQHTILELVEIAECEDLYATDCIYKLAEEEWKKSKICGSTRTHFAFSLAIYILFMLYFAWFITDFRRTFDSLASDVILTAFALLFFVLELIDLLSLPPNKILYCSSRRTKCSMYWRNVYNVFDFIALLLLWLGIVWKWVILGKSEYVTAYACQSVFSTSFLFFGFRSVEFLSSWQRTGAVIVILKNLIVKDLGPFLAIIAIVFLSFGVFFFNLLFPSITAEKSETRDTFYWWRVMLQIFTMPFDLLFTNYDRLEFDTPTSGSPQKVGSVTNAIGLSWFRNLTMFVFLLLVNIVMVNLLIALFSLRVSTLHSKAIGIWRQGYFELLLMYQRRAELCRSCVGRSASIYPDDNQDVVIDGKKYKKSYLRYLRYQAQQLRKIRPRLSQELEKNRSDFEQLKAHFENNMAQVQSETSEDLAHLQRKFKELEHAQNLSLQEILEILKRLPQQSQQEPETDQGRK
uniref:ANK_REP_REGION domain-containing protein n=1 Tax=Macrostomum lignano TaxID=282301 RepID=A0A1I8J1U5_9PLAT